MKTLLSIVFIMLIALSGCGGSTGTSTDNTSTTTDASNAATSTVETTMLVLNAIFGGEDASVSVAPTTLHDLDNIPDAGISPKSMTVTEATTDCSGISSSAISGGSTLSVQGSDLASDGSGSCTVTTAGFSEGDNYQDSSANLSCDSFSGGSATNYVTLDGNLGISVSSVDADDVFVINAAVGTTDLLMGFIEDGSTKLCDVAMLVYERVTITIGEESATSESTLYGCMSICGTSYDVSGSETQTVTF